MAVSDDLAQMLDSLIAMSRADRNFVLGKLAPELRERLRAMLDQAQRADLSAGLREAAAIARKDEVPTGMTRRAAAALTAAVSNEDAVSLSHKTESRVATRLVGALKAFGLQV